MTKAARERKAAVGTLYVYLVFLICYLPNTCYWIVHRSVGPSTMLSQFVLYTNTLIYLNSSLNPLIYSWKMRHVRHAIMEILRNILSHPHQWRKKGIKENHLLGHLSICDSWLKLRRHAAVSFAFSGQNWSECRYLYPSSIIMTRISRE